MKFVSGMTPLLYDERDAEYAAVAFGAPVMPVLPSAFELPKKRVRNQGMSLSCTAHNTTGASEYQEGVELSPAWHWAQTCKLLGSYVPNGSDPRTAMGVSAKQGDLEESLAVHKFETDDAQTIGNWNNWTTDAFMRGVIEQHQKAAYVPIQMVGDYFDSIRAALYKGNAVMAFGTWCEGWDKSSIPTAPSAVAGYHAYLFVGFNGDYLIIRNSYGSSFGSGGYQYMPRETVNREFAKYGTGLYTFVDLTPEQIARARENSVGGSIQRAIIRAWQQLMLLWN